MTEAADGAGAKHPFRSTLSFQVASATRSTNSPRAIFWFAHDYNAGFGSPPSSLGISSPDMAFRGPEADCNSRRMVSQYNWY